MTLQAAILAGLIGTVFMTLSSGSEAKWNGRPDSPAPGTAILWPLRLLGLNVEGRLLDIVAVWAHWTMGAAWGIVWWLLLVQAELNLALTAVLFYVIVDGTANIMLKVTGIAPWPWKWGLKYNIIDWWHHIMYAGGTLTAWISIEKIVEGSGGTW